MGRTLLAHAGGLGGCLGSSGGSLWFVFGQLCCPLPTDETLARKVTAELREEGGKETRFVEMSRVLW